MPTHATQDPQADARTALALYDTLMAEIEPELCSWELPALEERYAGETPEEHEDRMSRYELAYAVFDEAAKVLDDDVSFTAEVMRGASRDVELSKNAGVESDQLKRIENDIDSDAAA
jgi:hypothetical protein